MHEPVLAMWTWSFKKPHAPRSRLSATRTEMAGSGRMLSESTAARRRGNTAERRYGGTGTGRPSDAAGRYGSSVDTEPSRARALDHPVPLPDQMEAPAHCDSRKAP